MQTNLKIIIVEDHKGFGEALAFYLQKKLGHEVLFIANSAKDIYEFKNIYDADLIFMDIELPDENGFQIAKKLFIDFPKMKIIAMTMYEDKVYLRKIVSAGFKGALFKSDFYLNLQNAIEYVIAGKVYFPQNIRF